MSAKTLSRLAVLFVVSGALAASMAFAGKVADDYYNKLPSASCRLAPTGIEPAASGQAKLSGANIVEPGTPPLMGGTLSVTGRGLTPGETYSVQFNGGYGLMVLGTSAVSARGELKVTGTAVFLYEKGWTNIPVVVVNAAGAAVLQGNLVLR